jgi:hypothetical protein
VSRADKRTHIIDRTTQPLPATVVDTR